MEDNNRHDDIAAGKPAQTPGGQVKSRRKGFLVYAGVALAVFIAAGSVGAGVRWWQTRENEAVGPKPMQQDVSASQDAILAGDFDDAHQILDRALDKPNLSESEKVALTAQQGTVYENQQNYDKALEYYLRAAEIDLDMHLAVAIARVAEANGKNELAVEYYKKAIPLIPPDDPTSDSLKRLYEASVVRLGGQL